MIQTIMKPIHFPFLGGIQISGPLLVEIHFFIAMRCSKELAGQLSLKSKVSSFSSESSSISTHRNSLNFDSKFISNLDEFL
jgi:hypothetical protein